MSLTRTNDVIINNGTSTTAPTNSLELRNSVSSIILGTNLNTTPVFTTISPTAITQGANSISLQNLTLLPIVLDAVELPPNATTLQINNTLLLTDGSNNASLDINQVNGNLDIVTSGFPTFNNLPRCSVVPTNADELVNKAYADSIASTNASTITITDASDNNTYYPTFVAGTGTGQSLRTDFTPSGLSYNPSTATLTATNISGSISVANNNTNGVFYPVFVQNNASGIKPLLQDGLTNTLTYNPATSVMTATTFSGALTGNATTATDATNADNVLITSDNTNGTYFIPFSKTSGTGDKPLFQDDTTGPLTYNPSTATLTATNFSGNLTGNASTATTATDATNADNVLITSDNTNGTYFIPFSKTSGTGDKPLFQDDTTGPLTYNPSTATLTATNFSGNATSSGSVLVTSDNTSALCFLTFSKLSGTGNKTLFQDDSSGLLSYVPSTRQLTVARITPDPGDQNAFLTFVERCFIRRISSFGASMGNSNFQATGNSDYAVYMGDNGENNVNAPLANATYPNAKLNFKIGDVAYMMMDASAGRIGNVGIRNNTPAHPLDVTGNIRSSTSVLTPQVGNPSGNLNIRVDNAGAGGTLSFTGGTGLLSASAGGTSGQHLVVTINGTQYKIKLENP